MGQPLRALIVEDSEDDALLLVQQLRSAGYVLEFKRVDTAEAMSAALEASWDMIYSDHAMPHFSAPDALRMMQEAKLDAPFIVVSGAIGEERVVELIKAGAADYIPKGKLIRVGAITERALTDSADRRARKQAEQDVRAREFALDQKNKDLETILYVISHDLHEPLRAVQNFSQLLVERYADRLDEKGKDFLQRIDRAADRLDRLLEDILILSRAQRLVKPGEEVPGAELVKVAMERLDDRIAKTQASVLVAPDLPLLRVDRSWGIEAIYNLLSNALKFTRPNVPPEVEVAAYHGNGTEVGLVFRDRGTGVPADQAHRLFHLFQRCVGKEVEGTGAGLAIVQQIVQRHGGIAWYQPRPGGGSEFYITFSSETPQAVKPIIVRLQEQGAKSCTP